MRRLPSGLALVVAAFLALPVSAQAAGSLAFIRSGNIWIANPDGTGAKQLTTDGGYQRVSAAQGSGAPLLGFSRLTSGGTTYGVISAAGGSPTSVSTKSQPAEPFYDAQLSADGTKLAYLWQYYDQSISQFRHVYSIASVNGSAIADYFGGYGVEDTGFADPGASTVVWSGFIHDAYSSPSDSCTTNQVGLGVETPLAGGGHDTTQPTYWICPAGDDTVQPAVSPDGSKIAARVVATGTSGPGSVMVFGKANGASGTSLTPSGVDASEPAWSPDGSEIAYVAGGNLYTVPAGGGTPSQVLSDASFPAWTPYGLPSPGPNPPPPPGPMPAPPKPPQLHSLIRGHKARFTFSAQGAAGFQCSLVKLKPNGKKAPKPHYSGCRSPKAYKGLRSGRYEFFVRGQSSAGSAGRASTRKFKV